ncbi:MULTISPECIES: T6SS effector amidase Tae4 family protein [Pseudoalteromonas]|uniref:T6SS effector amidase Tae4 family protein n=1 Tax=Pseudoalteromonas TaxID=53246 RepID=UPI001E55522F|nr:MULTISPECIES: T6SS effector amidase Tae4 family protein [unclassified Pseudoalteromonas]
MIVKFNKLWSNHPYPDAPCDKSLFGNQCAIRMGVALEKSGIDTSSFDSMYPQRRCYPGLKHSPRHILAAQELANWIDSPRSTAFGTKKVIKGGALSKLKDKKGIIFIMNGWGNTDHIDLWDGEYLKGGNTDWLNLGDEIWFWEILV